MKQQLTRILIVDDDEDLLFLLKHQLSTMGYEVETCFDGIDLMGKMMLFQPRFVLMDITMNSINGADLCHRIKEDKRFQNVKILLMSGNHDIKRIALSCHADGFIPKPVDPSIITSYIGPMQENS